MEPDTHALARQSLRVSDALRTVIRKSPAAGLGPLELSRALGVDKSLASRLMTALRAGDPLTTLSALPGTVPLRDFVRAARQKGADRKASDAAERELVAFDQALERTFGTRTRLDAALSDALPEMRRKHQETARQSVFRGMTLIKGISIDTASVTWLVHPCPDDPERTDSIVVVGFLGVRRLRPSATVRFMGRYAGARPQQGARLLREFCRPHNISIDSRQVGNADVYEISTGLISGDSAADVFLTETIANCGPRALGLGAEPLILGDSVAHPYKRLTLNVLVHRDVWPGCSFELEAYDTAMRLGERRNPADRLFLEEAVRNSRVSATALRSSPVPGYESLLRSCTSGRPLDLEDLQMFSADVVYPVYGSEVLMVYDPSA
jgi:hypothetical protein